MKILVNKMMCEHCEKRVVQVALGVEGVKKAFANHKEEMVTLEIDDLVECVAERIAAAILDEYQMVEKVDVSVKKPHAPISADFDYVGVEITRGRQR